VRLVLQAYSASLQGTLYNSVCCMCICKLYSVDGASVRHQPRNKICAGVGGPSNCA
jgi:hypothetical protein